jgi:hypothetical protein
LGEHRQVGVEPNPVHAANAKREQGPLVLGTAEGAFHGGAVGVELSPAQRLSRDQRMEAVGLDPT